MNGGLQKVMEIEHKQRVLVVEDDELLRHQAKLVLRTSGMEVCEAASGEAALELLDRETPDAVLLDVRMPGIDGFETCRRIRELRRGEFLPVIVATGLDDMESIEAAYRAGATDFVVKPINWTILKHRIKYTMNARSMAEDLVVSTDHQQGLLRTIPDAILNLDGEGRVVEVRLPEANWVAGDSLFSAGRSLYDTLPPAAAARARSAIASIRDGASQISFEFEVELACGTRSYEVYLAAAGRDSMVVLVRDFTERREAEKEIRKLAYFDRATGLPNRDMLQQYADARAEGVESGGRNLSVLRIDLQGLDYARSLLGNQVADELLRACAERLRELVTDPRGPRPSASGLAGRVNDAGFAFVRDDLGDESALRSFANHVHEHMSGRYTLGDYEIEVNARLGIAYFDKQSDQHPRELFDRAEMALAEAQSGPSFYSEATTDRRKRRARLLKDLQSALSNGELHLEYQPKVGSGDRRLRGVEALVRWSHPTHGPVSPGEFIPLAEESGLILPIGEFVLQEACRQSRHWREVGRVPVPIAINFSGHQFSKRGVVESLLTILKEHDVDPDGIEIELTETVAMEHCAGIHTVLQELRESGITTAIDDFGTGYSSLNNLRQFRFHTLKIDRSFVSDLDRNSSAKSIIRGIITMSHALGMQVVAEGVEEGHQLDFLREQGCDLIQGYLTGRPVRGEMIEAMLQ